MTLRRKLLLWYSGVFFLSAAVLVTSIYFLIRHKTKRDFFRSLDNEYSRAERITKENLDNEEPLRQDVEVEVMGRKHFRISYRLYDVQRGQDLLIMGPKWAKAMPARPYLEETDVEPRVSRLRVGDDAADVVYLETGWLDRDSYPGLVLQVGMSYERVYKRLAKMGEYLLYALLFSVILSFLGGRFLAARSLDPVDKIATSLERIQAENLSERLAEPGARDEIGRIVSSANAMLSRLEESFEQVRRFAGDTAHELRTPLAGLKCRLEAALSTEGTKEEARSAMADALQEVNELTSVVNNLLLLASLDAADAPTGATCVKLADIFRDIGEVFEVLAEQKGLELRMSFHGECAVKGDQTLLHRLFCNLIENAIRYTPSGRVEVNLWREGNSCHVAVSDTGIGIAPADVNKVFDRFYRADTSRSRKTGGTGLGLSICQRIVELHGGTIEIESLEGKGTTVTVALPALEVCS